MMNSLPWGHDVARTKVRVRHGSYVVEVTFAPETDEQKEIAEIAGDIERAIRVSAVFEFESAQHNCR